MTKVSRMMIVAVVSGCVWGGTAWAGKLLLPLQCDLGRDCFAQQFPDMDPGAETRDPFCGAASYNGHKGLDVRVISMRDIARDVPVVAVADGEVLRFRDTEPDRLVTSDELRAAVQDKECGNGVVVSHPEGVEVQYCHMKSGSVAVSVGEKVKAGQKLGAVGASGLAAFPHTHITVRKDGVVVDPTSGVPITEGCQASAISRAGMFTEEVQQQLTGETALLGFGITGAPFGFDSLVVDGPPPTVRAGDTVTAGWVWGMNIRKGDLIRLDIVRPDGSYLVATTTEPHQKNQATFLQIAGKREVAMVGEYQIRTGILREGEEIVMEKKTVVVAP